MQFQLRTHIMECLDGVERTMEVQLWLVDVFARAFPKLSADVRKRRRQRSLGGSSRRSAHGFFGGTKPAHVDPGFASDRD